MQQLVPKVVIGFQAAGFALVCLFVSPMILFKFGVDCVRDRIETHWRDSDRARAASAWLGLLLPVILCIVVVLALARPRSN